MGQNDLKREIHALQGGSDHFWEKMKGMNVGCWIR